MRDSWKVFRKNQGLVVAALRCTITAAEDGDALAAAAVIVGNILNARRLAGTAKRQVSDTDDRRRGSVAALQPESYAELRMDTIQPYGTLAAQSAPRCNADHHPHARPLMSSRKWFSLMTTCFHRFVSPEAAASGGGVIARISTTCQPGSLVGGADALLQFTHDRNGKRFLERLADVNVNHALQIVTRIRDRSTEIFTVAMAPGPAPSL